MNAESRRDIAMQGLSDLLHPIEESVFFDKYWEQQPLHIAGNGAGRRAGLLTLEAMDQLLSDTAFRADECKIALEGQIVPPASYLAEPGPKVMGRAAADHVDAAAALGWFDRGATLVFAQLNQRWPALQELKQALEEALSASVLTNVFLSNRNSQGFSLHYDSHDVFVVQLHGQKVWSLHGNPVELATKSEAFGTTGVAPGPLTATVTLEPGDVLYVPRGYFHAAKTTDTVSLHVTLGVHPYLWVDFLADMVRRLGSECVGLRRSLPRDLLKAGEAERMALIRGVLADAVNSAGSAPLAGKLVAEARRACLQSGPRPLRHHLAELLQREDLAPHTPLWLRDVTRPCEVVHRGDIVLVQFRGRTATFPSDHAPMIAAMQTMVRFTVADLPGDCTPEAKQQLVHSLIGLGVLVTAPASSNRAQARVW